MAYNGQAADIFSAGVVLYEALTGRLPFGDETALDEGANVLARALAMYALQDGWVRLPASVVPAQIQQQESHTLHMCRRWRAPRQGQTALPSPHDSFAAAPGHTEECACINFDLHRWCLHWPHKACTSHALQLRQVLGVHIAM